MRFFICMQIQPDRFVWGGFDAAVRKEPCSWFAGSSQGWDRAGVQDALIILSCGFFIFFFRILVRCRGVGDVSQVEALLLLVTALLFSLKSSEER